MALQAPRSMHCLHASEPLLLLPLLVAMLYRNRRVVSSGERLVALFAIRQPQTESHEYLVNDNP